MLKPLRLGRLDVDPPLFLAPMAGLTDRDFRLIVRRIGGVGVVTMEFLASKGLVRGEKQVTRLMHFAEEERPLGIQIYGSDPETMAEAARIVEASGADLCDINMGCPANKVLKGCAGAALMGDLDLAERIVVAVRRAISIPLTVKFRLGLDDERRNFIELGKICEGSGADAVAMHARTARQMFRGVPAWARIGELQAALSIPVLGNGDVRTADDALEMLRKTGCAGVMVGRGATRNPWIFHEIADRLGDRHDHRQDHRQDHRHGSGTRRAVAPTLEDRRRLILEHFQAVIEREDEGFALHKLRTFTKWYSQGLPEGQRLRRRLQDFEDAASLLEAVDTFFDELGVDPSQDAPRLAEAA